MLNLIRIVTRIVYDLKSAPGVENNISAARWSINRIADLTVIGFRRILFDILRDYLLVHLELIEKRHLLRRMGNFNENLAPQITLIANLIRLKIVGCHRINFIGGNFKILGSYDAESMPDAMRF